MLPFASGIRGMIADGAIISGANPILDSQGAAGGRETRTAGRHVRACRPMVGFDRDEKLGRRLAGDDASEQVWCPDVRATVHREFRDRRGYGCISKTEPPLRSPMKKPAAILAARALQFLPTMPICR